MDILESPLSELDCGAVIDTFPTELIFFADWDSKQYQHFTNVYFIDQNEVPVQSALLCSCKIYIKNHSADLITLSIMKGNIECLVEFRLFPKVNFEYAPDTLHKLVIIKGQTFSKPSSLLYILNERPINIFYENLSKLVGCVLFEFSPDKIKLIDDSQIISHSWPSTVNVFKEYYSPDDTDQNGLSIHEYIIEQAKKEFDAVFYDHASLEIADVIGFRKNKIQFWHCKKQNNPEPNCSITNIYEVCGQAVKSVMWSNRKILVNQICDRAVQNNSSVKLKKGNLQTIQDILLSFDNPALPIEITIVHPGLKTQNLDHTQKSAFERIKLLLS